MRRRVVYPIWFEGELAPRKPFVYRASRQWWFLSLLASGSGACVAAAWAIGAPLGIVVPFAIVMALIVGGSVALQAFGPGGQSTGVPDFSDDGPLAPLESWAASRGLDFVWQPDVYLLGDDYPYADRDHLVQAIAHGVVRGRDVWVVALEVGEGPDASAEWTPHTLVAAGVSNRPHLPQVLVADANALYTDSLGSPIPRGANPSSSALDPRWTVFGDATTVAKAVLSSAAVDLLNRAELPRAGAVQWVGPGVMTIDPHYLEAPDDLDARVDLAVDLADQTERDRVAG